MKGISYQYSLKMMSAVVGVILLITITASPLKGETSFQQFPEFKPGDYFKCKLTADNLLDSIGEGIAGDDYLGAENVSIDRAEYRITGVEMITIGGIQYSCVIAVFTWELNFTLVFEEGSTDTDDDRLAYEMIFESKEWMVKTNRTIIKHEETTETNMTYKRDGEDHLYRSEKTTKNSFISFSGEVLKFPFKVGETWSCSATYISNSTEKSKTDDDEWEVEYSEEEITVTTEIEIVGENTVTVEAGTFTCAKIKFQDHGESEYRMEFYTKSGVPVKILKYAEDGTLGMSLELRDYKMANEKTDDGMEDDDETGFISGFEVTAVALGTLLVAVFLKKNTK